MELVYNWPLVPIKIDVKKKQCSYALNPHVRTDKMISAAHVRRDKTFYNALPLRP